MLVDMKKPAAVLNKRNELLTQLVRKYHQPLVDRAAGIVGEIYAEEVVQDTWETLISALHDLRETSSIKPWLYKVVVNKSINRYKREQRVESIEQRGSDTDASMDYLSNSMHNSNTAGYENSTESVVTMLQQSERMIQAWLSLPNGQKKAIELRFMNGYSYAEIAKTLEITLTNSKVTLHRAKSRLVNVLLNDE